MSVIFFILLKKKPTRTIPLYSNSHRRITVSWEEQSRKPKGVTVDHSKCKRSFFAENVKLFSEIMQPFRNIYLHHVWMLPAIMQSCAALCHSHTLIPVIDDDIGLGRKILNSISAVSVKLSVCIWSLIITFFEMRC